MPQTAQTPSPLTPGMPPVMLRSDFDKASRRRGEEKDEKGRLEEMRTSLIIVRHGSVTGFSPGTNKTSGMSATLKDTAKRQALHTRDSISVPTAGSPRPTSRARSTAGDRSAGFDLSLMTSNEPEKLRSAFLQTYQRMTEAFYDLSEARQKLSDATEQLSKERIDNITNVQKLKVQSFEILATAGAAYARGVMETLEHRARCSIPELREERNRQVVWNAMLAREEYNQLSECLWIRCRWASKNKKRGVGEDAGKQMDALYAYLCSNIHFASIARVPTGQETGILLPKSVGVVESSYSKALICMLDFLPVNWTVLDGDWKPVDSSQNRRGIAEALEDEKSSHSLGEPCIDPPACFMRRLWT